MIISSSTLITIAIIVIVLALITMSFFTINQQSIAVIERLGKFARVARPGLNLKIPLIEKVAGQISLRVMPLNVVVETKTKDNVFAQINVSVQYQVIPEKVYEAFYKLSNYEAQIKSFIFDVVRAQVPKLDLDEVFEKKDDIALAVQKELSQTMSQFGFAILNALVTDVNPDESVKIAMNEINAAQRQRVAATEKGEAEKILKIKQAEAEAESMRLQGEGLAGARKAIIDGVKKSVEDFKAVSPDINVKDIMTLVLMTQYCDTLKEVGAKSGANTIFLSSSPSAITDIESQVRNGLMAGNAAKV